MTEGGCGILKFLYTVLYHRYDTVSMTTQISAYSVITMCDNTHVCERIAELNCVRSAVFHCPLQDIKKTQIEER